jgi:hypothetical protein
MEAVRSDRAAFFIWKKLGLAGSIIQSYFIAGEMQLQGIGIPLQPFGLAQLFHRKSVPLFCMPLERQIG